MTAPCKCGAASLILGGIFMPDTIAAIATGTIISAIGIIRLSGDDAINVVDRVFTPSFGGRISEAQDRKLVYGSISASDGAVIDYCLCTISRAPNSYTGENTAELQCHGSPVVLRAVLDSLFVAGARQATAGEFTKRAFLNRRLDLTSAEAVIDLINSETEEAAKNAAGQLGGAICRKTDGVYDSLKAISAHYHAVLDYPDEDIEPFELEQYKKILSDAETELSKLLSTFERGKLMQNGIPAAILGKPNVGKSSLLNAILGYDRAIVTDIPGTTRDTISERVTLGGVLLKLIDTAGIRNTNDPVEVLGVERSRAAAKEAELALILIDGSTPVTQEDSDIIDLSVIAKKSILVFTKIDLSQNAAAIGIIGAKADATVCVSSVTGEGLDALGEAVSNLFPSPTASAQGEILTNSRHADAVSRALESLRAAIEAVALNTTPDIVLTEAERAMSALGELTGRTVREDVTTEIFSRFCVGK